MLEKVSNRQNLRVISEPQTAQLVSFYAGFSAHITGQATVLSTQMKAGGKFFWLPVSYSVNRGPLNLSSLLPSFHLSRCELREYIGAGANLGMALPEPLPSPLANLRVAPLLAYKTSIEKFREQRTTTTLLIGGDCQIGVRILPFEINLIDVQIFYSLEERLVEVIGSPLDFGLTIPFTLADAGEWGIIPFSGKVAGKIQPLLKLELYWDELKRWLNSADSQTQSIIDLNVKRSTV
jgi:hypothetical protein